MTASEGADALRAWTATSIDEVRNWYYPLPDVCLEAFEQVKRPTTITEARLPEYLRAPFSDALQPVRNALERSRGFAIIDGPRQSLTPQDARLLYWLVGQGIGRPFAQNIEGALLYDVRDLGQDISKGARVSVTKYESSFHTDNSFGEEILDYVGLLCLQAAKAGGRSQMISGHAVYRELQANRPDVLATLGQPFSIDRRAGVRAGESPTVRFPVFHRQNGNLIVRYLRLWIEAGHENTGQPLTTAQVAALDSLDEVLGREEMRVEFDLQPGQMYFINNQWILHNRTAFEDHSELERRRHLVRLWLKSHA